MKGYDTLIITLPRDYERCRALQGKLLSCLPGDKIYYVGNEGIKKLIEEEQLGERVGYILEDSIIPYDKVHSILCDIYQRHDVSRGITGWYYQQFLKMQYARVCEKDYYLVWDGDTVPCKMFHMFHEEDGVPCFDLKTEYHEGYFDTLSRILPGMKKCLKKSFISEHMLFSKKYMCEMLEEIESNSALKGNTFYEKVLYCMSQDEILESNFSEFETYGTYMTLKHPGEYRYRVWHSFRHGATFFDPATISEEDYAWMGKDFAAISFEKGDSLREDTRNIFDNKRYQSMFTARQVLEIAQQEFEDGYIEVWD